MSRQVIRVVVELFFTFLFCWLYIPHLFCYLFKFKSKQLIDEDLARWKEKTYIKMPKVILLLYKLHNDVYFRTIFYHRIGPFAKGIIGWYRKGSPTFIIPSDTVLGGGIYATHCYSTILNAKRIGSNFTVIQNTTLGKKNDLLPIIEDNVVLGANVVIIGGITIGANSIIGAGSVVVKSIPSNCVACGNPAKVIRSIVSQK